MKLWHIYRWSLSWDLNSSRHLMSICNDRTVEGPTRLLTMYYTREVVALCKGMFLLSPVSIIRMMSEPASALLITEPRAPASIWSFDWMVASLFSVSSLSTLWTSYMSWSSTCKRLAYQQIVVWGAVASIWLLHASNIWTSDALSMQGM
jgi:hypothetical protein